MATELRLHGQISPVIAYYATAAGCRSAHHHFYAVDDRCVRFFSPGNELVLTADSVSQRGTGGSFCEYMFGDRQPRADRHRPGPANRLVMLGVLSHPGGQVELCDQLQAERSYADIFTRGHAIHNDFFFVEGLPGASPRERQQQVLRHLGKPIKRLAEPGQCDDSELAAQLLALLPAGCTLYLVRLTHTGNQRFQQELRRRYYRGGELPQGPIKELDDLAAELNIDAQQQERIRLDVLYRHRNNYRVVDNYKKLLLSCTAQGRIPPVKQQQLGRLKTLALRQQVPESLLLSLERSYAPQLDEAAEEPGYLCQARDLLHQLQSRSCLTNPQLAALLMAGRVARHQHDQRFDQLLAGIGAHIPRCENPAAPAGAADWYDQVVSLFQRCDSTATAIGRIVLLDNHPPDEEMLHRLFNSRMEFDRIQRDLFVRLFFTDLQKSNFLGHFGRRKLTQLRLGLDAMAAGNLSLKQLHDELLYIANEQQHYNHVLNATRDWIADHKVGFTSRAEQQNIYATLGQEFSAGRTLNIPLDRQLFETVMSDLTKEDLYLRHFLPDIISNNNPALREDFFNNSGLDYFHIEELELRYVTDNNLEPEVLQRLQCGFH
ncbi:MAG: TIGR04442 family protein [Pelovirga sp.]